MTGADIMIIYNWEMIKRNCINQKNHNLKLTHCCQMKLILIPNLLELTFWLELTFSFQLPCCSTNLNFTVFQEIEKKKSCLNFEHLHHITLSIWRTITNIQIFKRPTEKSSLCRQTNRAPTNFSFEGPTPGDKHWLK